MPQTYKPKHRHFLVVPIFALMLTISLITSGVLLSSQTWQLFGLLTAEDKKIEGVVVHEKSGTVIRKAEGSRINTEGESARLELGSVLLDGQSLVPLRAGGFYLLGLNGAYSATLISEKLVVSAVSSPVLIDDGNSLMVVPIGHEWSSQSGLQPLYNGLGRYLESRQVKRIPAEFLKRKLELIKQMQPLKPALLPDEKLFKTAMGADLLLPQLPKAQEISEETALYHLVGYLRTKLDKDNLEDLQKVLSEPNLKNRLTTENGKKYLGALLAETRNTSLTWLPLFRIFGSEQNIALLSAFHPQFLNGAWVLGSDSLDKESRLLRLMLLPISDVLPDKTGDFVLERFKQEARLIADELVDPAVYLELLFTIGTGMVKTYQDLGYPARAKRMTDALIAVGLYKNDVLNEVTANMLQKLENYDSIDMDFRPVVAESERPDDFAADQKQTEEVNEQKTKESVLVVKPQFTDDQITARARMIISKNKGIITVNTKITSLGNNAARAEGVVYLGKDGTMKVYSFNLDALEQKVFNIELDGKRYPNAVSMPAFVNWVTENI